ncbi:hypothetical protein [Methylocystis sp.]|uniref:hypothetical protein n=1 Tax=Methylocystis sp. TaxID=1911079 RepID=UPI003DA33EE1
MSEHEPDERVRTDEDAKRAIELRQQEKKIHFLISNFLGVIISVFAALFSNATLGHLDALRSIGETGAQFVTQLHWLVLFSSAIFLYVLICYMLSKIYFFVSGFVGFCNWAPKGVC